MDVWDPVAERLCCEWKEGVSTLIAWNSGCRKLRRQCLDSGVEDGSGAGNTKAAAVCSSLLGPSLWICLKQAFWPFRNSSSFQIPPPPRFRGSPFFGRWVCFSEEASTFHHGQQDPGGGPGRVSGGAPELWREGSQRAACWDENLLQKNPVGACSFQGRQMAMEHNLWLHVGG